MEPNLDPSRSSPHIPEDTLERYAMDRLSEAEVEEVETHLLVCEHCQQMLTETEQYVRAMKGGLAERQAQEAAERSGWWDKLRRPHPLTAFATAAVGLSLVAFVAGRNPAPQPVPVDLRAIRGDSGSIAEGKANAPLDLGLRASEWKLDGTFRVRIVDAGGREVWTGVPEPESDGGAVHLETGLPQGSYWVRLYDSKDMLLQEYGLRLTE